jgi:diguanylate cyclase (GGDEF)-like protein/PAS domain S-box-containing protein
VRVISVSKRSVEPRFEAAFDHAPFGLCLVAPGGDLLRVNVALCHLFGRSEEDLLAGDLRRLTHPADLAVDRALLAETIDNVRSGYEMDKRYLRSDGSVIQARLAVSLVRASDDTPEFLICQIIDLTELKQVQSELADWKARTQSILDHSPTVMFLRDLDGCWVTVNRRLQEVLGRTEEELRGLTMDATHTQDERERYSADDRLILSDGKARDFDITFRDASRGGEERHFWLQKFPVPDAEGNTIGLGGVSIDVTDRERLHRELLAARQRFAVAFENATVGMLISRLAADGNASEVLSCNPAFAEMLGYERAEVVGQAGIGLTHPDDLDARNRLIDDARAGRRTSHEIRMRRRDGQYVWTLVAPAMIQNADGDTEMVVQALDIAERKHFEGQLRHLADHDALTGLYSRRRFGEEIARALARVRRYGGHSCLLLIDLDGFKYVNDAFGHSAGDEVLIRIGSALGHTLRELDVVGRIGGDEFAIILGDTDVGGALTAAAKLISTVRAHGTVVRDGRRAQVTASVGLTAIDPGASPDAEDLLVEADIAMYEAKEAGKDQVAVYRRAGRRREDLTRRTDLIGRLHTAIDDDLLVLHGQPIVPLRPDAPVREHFELLLRLREGDELLLPEAFLYHAERDGLIADIDRWVLRQAITMLGLAQQDGRSLSLSVNLSGKTVEQPGIAEDLATMLDATPIAPGALTIEITETAAITNVTRAAELARQLRALGCRLALDDFGAGFASFFYLKHLVFDTLKIDGEFIARLPSSSTDQLIVRAIVDVAHGLDAEIVAEHVTDRATVDILLELGVHYGQGFHLGRPAPMR